MNIIEKLQWRYATKKFDDNLYITNDKLNMLKKAFNLTASSYGLQPIKLVIIKNKILQASLVEYSMNQEQVGQASHVLVFCIETNIDKDYIKAYFNRVKTIRQTPDIILKPFKDFLLEDFKEKPTKAIEDWAIKQAYLAMGNLLTVCAIEEIDACPMEGFSPKHYDTILKLNKLGLQSVLVMPIGYRDKGDMLANLKKVRKTVAESTIEL